MNKRTKVLATLGPASSSPEVIARMLAAGMDIVRLNMAHGTHAEHAETIRQIRAAEQTAGLFLPIHADLGGPKLRVGVMPGGKPLALKRGDAVIFAPERTAQGGEIPVTFPKLAADVEPGVRMLLDDGNLSVEVTAVRGERIQATVVDGGFLKDHKGINLPGVTLSTDALTEKDISDLEFLLKAGVDSIGISFVQNPRDIARAREIMQRRKRPLPIVAKIERRIAVARCDEICAAADALMVARGDLGVETPMEEVPILQKRIIATGAKHRKPVIVATQMLESMVEHPRPTRAEVSDVATAVFEGADAVMLSAETSIGQNPVAAVSAMARIARAAEVSPYKPHVLYEPAADDDSVELATTRAACFAAEEARAKVICSFTMTAASARMVSAQRPPVDIIAVTEEDAIARRASMLWGVRAIRIPRWKSIDAMIENGMNALKQERLAAKGDKVVVICGTAVIPGAANVMKVVKL